MQACTDQAALFVSTFGLERSYEGVSITFDNLDIALDAGLDISWLVGALRIDMSSLRDENDTRCSCDICTSRHALADGKSGEVFGLIVAWAREQDQKAMEEQSIENTAISTGDDFPYDADDDYVTENEQEQPIE